MFSLMRSISGPRLIFSDLLAVRRFLPSIFITTFLIDPFLLIPVLPQSSHSLITCFLTSPFNVSRLSFFNSSILLFTPRPPFYKSDINLRCELYKGDVLQYPPRFHIAVSTPFPPHYLVEALRLPSDTF